MNDKLIITVDRNEKSNEFGICVMREEANGKIRILKMELDDEARVLYRALTDQSFKIQQRNEQEQEPRPKGQWLESRYEMTIYCSECLEEFDNGSNFCPNCGADMRGNE